MSVLAAGVEYLGQVAGEPHLVHHDEPFVAIRDLRDLEAVHMRGLVAWDHEEPCGSTAHGFVLLHGQPYDLGAVAVAALADEGQRNGETHPLSRSLDLFVGIPKRGLIDRHPLRNRLQLRHGFQIACAGAGETPRCRRS
jgi:hypothetical protein